jgi:hypothetical protein
MLMRRRASVGAGAGSEWTPASAAVTAGFRFDPVPGSLATLLLLSGSGRGGDGPDGGGARGAADWVGSMDLANRASRAALATMLAAAAAAAAAASQTELPVLGRLERGLWQLRSLEGGGNIAAVCLGDRGLLTQLRHRGVACRRTLVGHSQDSLEIHYNCPAAFGQTVIRVETPQLARVESQGVDNGIPFGFRAEARRIGACR